MNNETWQRWMFVLLTAAFLAEAVAPASADTQAVIRGKILRVTGDDLPNDGQPDVLVGGTGPDTFVRYAGENDWVVDFDEAEGDVFIDLP